jgi:hypothetical protein
VLKSNSLCLNILDLIKCTHYVRYDEKYIITHTHPATGILYVTSTSPFFISGQVRMRGRDGGRYPYQYEEMIDHLFGTEKNRIEVCSGSIKGRDTATSNALLSSLKVKDSLSSTLNLSSSSSSLPFTVDINPGLNPDYVADAQRLEGISNGVFSRWMCDPPYNLSTARDMYGPELPTPIKLLKAGARVCKVGSIMFLLLGPQNYQICPAGVRRIGWIPMSIVPNNEVRCLNIYLKHEDV